MIRNKYPVVRIGSPAHAAWCDFYRTNRIKQFFPDNMTVFSEWPPVNEYELTVFANQLAETRAKLDDDDADFYIKVDRHALPSNIRPYHISPNSYQETT